MHITHDLAAFAARMQARATNVARNAPEIQRRCAVAILQGVVLATPVGNVALWGAKARAGSKPGYVGGRARANWQVSLGGPPSGTTDRHDAGGASTIADGIGTIQGARLGGRIVIGNNLPYIVPLNEGHSRQAPSGFVEAAVQKGYASVREAKIVDSI